MAKFINSTQRQGRRFYLQLFGWRFGYEYSPIIAGDRRYMTRHILYLGAICLRLHKFYRGDDARAPHDHPFWFVTFPLATYLESVPVDSTWWTDGLEHWEYAPRYVRAWRFHFRPAEYRHIVVGRADDYSKPFWTFVIAGLRTRIWGFWPTPINFVKWWEWV